MGCEELVEYVRCVCVWLGEAWVERGGEWMRGLGLDFTNPVGTGGVLDVCLCFGCSGVGGVGGEWVGAWTRVLRGGVVLCLCEVLIWILCVDGRSRICVLWLVDTCASEVHLVFNPVARYGYLLPNMYLFIADITNPDSFM